MLLLTPLAQHIPVDLLIAKYYQWEKSKGELDNVDYDKE